MTATEPMCLDHTVPMTLCIDRLLVEVLNAVEAEQMGRDAEPLTTHDVVMDALVDYLRSIGRLPKPYV